MRSMRNSRGGPRSSRAVSGLTSVIPGRYLGLGMTASKDTDTTADRGSLLLPLLVVIAAAAVFGAGSLVLPMGRDQGAYAGLADQVLRGKVMYRDLLVDVPPMAVVVNMIALSLFGHSMAAIRILELLMAAATATLVFGFFLRGWGGRWSAAIAGAFYPFLYYQFGFSHSAQPDGFANLPVAAAMLAALAALERPRAWRWLLAGALAALALLFRPTLWLLLPGLATVAWLYSDGGRKWRHPLWLGTGVLAVGCGMLLAVAASGALPDFLRTAVGVPSPDGGADFGYTGIAGRLVPTLTTYLLEPDFCIGALMGVVGLAMTLVAFPSESEGQSRRGSALLVMLCVAAALFSVFVQGAYYFNHYAPMLPGLAVFCALAVTGILAPAWRRLRRKSARVLAVGVVVLTFILASVLPSRLFDMVQVARGALKQPDYFSSRRFNSGKFSLAQNLAAAEFLTAKSAESDRVFVWATEPLVGFVADRPGATRFAFNRVMRADWPRNRFARELERELSQSPPEWFLAWHGDLARWSGRESTDSYTALLESPELRRFVLDNYELEMTMGRLDILRRSNSERASVGGAELDEDLQEALAFCSKAASQRYRSVLWPGGDIERLARQAEVGDRLMSYRSLNQMIWLGRDLSGQMPALSIWIAGDDRAFAALSPWRYQSDGDHFVADDYRFTLLHTCANRLVFVYEVDAATGQETVQSEE